MGNKPGKVYLVGAGCGDADLISVRGMKRLKACEVLVYDDLIAPELIDSVPEGAERIYVGKRSGKHSASQKEINEILVKKALEGKTVVRLKGGDPFVFGRGGEEIAELQAQGIPCDEVPGISSVFAIPAAAGIPVTHRGLSRSVHIVTAHTSDSADGLPECFDYLAKMQGTLVFLMGLSKVKIIAERLIAAGMAETTPAAVLSGGNSKNPADVRGTLCDIAKKAELAGVKSPAIILVGEVAALNFSSTIKLPLSGKRIGITGTAAVTDKLRSALSDLGAEVIYADRAAVTKLPTDFDFTELSSDSKKLLVFTSANGVRMFFDELSERRFDLRRLNKCSFAVIGRATGEQLEQHGFLADICPNKYTSEALAAAIEAKWREGKVIIFRAAEGSKALYERLQKHFEVRDYRIYTVVGESTAREDEAAPDYITFSSAGGVKRYFDRHSGKLGGAIPVVIGEVTCEELRKHYEGKIVMAKTCTAEGMTAALLADCKKEIG